MRRALSTARSLAVAGALVALAWRQRRFERETYQAYARLQRDVVQSFTEAHESWNGWAADLVRQLGKAARR